MFRSKLKLAINIKWHVMFIFCFFLISQYFRGGFTAVPHSRPHKNLSAQVGRKLKKFGKKFSKWLLEQWTLTNLW